MKRPPGSEVESGLVQVTWAFVHDRIDDLAMLEWAIKLGAEERSERWALREEFDRRQKHIKEPYRLAWQLVFEMWERPSPGNSYDRIELKKQLHAGALPHEIIRELTDAVRPWIQVETWDRIKQLYGTRQPRTAKSVEDLLHITFVSGALFPPYDLNLSEISDAGFLEELVRSLDNALFACLSLARHVGQISDEFDLTDWQVKRAYQVASAVSGGDPDRYVRGFAACTKLLSAALERLAAVKVTAAARLVAGMPRQHWRLYARLWAAAARDGNVVPASEVETFLDDVDRTMFWSTSSAPEVSELRAVRWQSMSIEGRKKIERRLRKGYPAALVSQRLTEQEREEARARRAIAEVERIRAAGGLLSNATERWATRLGEGLPTGPQITSVTQGFKTGARVQSVPLPNGSKLHSVPREKLLDVLSADLTNLEGWDEQSVGASRFLGDNPELALDLIEEAKAHPEVLSKLWIALGGYHAPSDVNIDLDEADETILAEVRVAQLVLQAVGAMDDTLRHSLIGPMASWMDSWGRLLGREQLFIDIWLEIWPSAISLVNRSDLEDCSLRDRAYTSSVGNLLRAVFSVSPDVGPSNHALEQARWPEILSAVAQADAESGLQTRYKLTESLTYYYFGSPRWTMEYLVAPLLEPKGEALQVWAAFASSPLPQDEIMQVAGEALSKVVTDAALGDNDRQYLAQHLVRSHLYSQLPNPYSFAVPAALSQQALRMSSNTIRAAAIEPFKDILQKSAEFGLTPASAFDLVLSVFADIWPQERTLNSSPVAAALVDLPAAAGTKFADAASMILPYLVPFDCWSLYEFGVWQFDDDEKTIHNVETAKDAQAFLAILDRTVGDGERSVIPNGLDQALCHLLTKSPKLEKDARFQRLLTLSRR